MLVIIGTCSLCEGPVSMPHDYRPGTRHPKPTCDWCGATQHNGYGPVLRMEKPMISRRAAREGRPGLTEKDSER